MIDNALVPKLFRPLVVGCSLLALAACGGEADDDGMGISPMPGESCPAGESLEIALTTDDGVALIADLYVADDPTGAPAVILLHMIPPSNTKSNYPTAFAETLQSNGFTVLNVNRRGAPGSGGTASDAYSGPNGKLDAKAAYDYAKAECEVGAYSMIGASNGTTTVVDFAIHAAETASIEAPASIIGLSGGTYTENQHSIADNLESLPGAALFAYPTGEASWNDGIAAIAPMWDYVDYAPGAHGTGLFTTNPEISDVLLAFLQGA